MRDAVEHDVDVRRCLGPGVLGGHLHALSDGHGCVDLVVEENLPCGNAKNLSVNGGQAEQLPVLGEVALDRVVEIVQLLRGTRDNGSGVVRYRRDGVERVLRQLRTVLNDGDRVDVAGFRLKKNVYCPAARTVTRAVSFVIGH